MSVSREEVLEYHRGERPGKLQIQATKPLLSQRDLSRAYSPGVAYAVEEIDRHPLLAYEYTVKGNLVAVVTNGSAVLGLGNRGPLAAKPVMEGKALLFKRLADVDVFDIELDARGADEIVAATRAIAPGFGGINLEDIAAPTCFAVEERLRELLDIPVFHDDQHGTAIIVAAALLNALALIGKELGRLKVVVNGAGAAGVACATMFLHLGVPRENILMFDRWGIIYRGRTEEMDPYKGRFAQATSLRTLGEALAGADVFLGVSVGNVVTPEMLMGMAADPILFLLANPDPEIAYDLAVATRPDAIVATGRSDYPNQVNNVLAFPFVFRGALDVRASAINEEMKLAAAHALAALAREPVPESVLEAYGLEHLTFGRQYIIPKPNDYRVLDWVAPAVAEAAMRSGVARQDLDLSDYRLHLRDMQRHGWNIMYAIEDRARRNRQRVVFAEGEHPRVLRAVQQILQDGTAEPILLGRPDVIRERVAELGLTVPPRIVEPEESADLERYAEEIYRLRHRKGVSKQRAHAMARAANVFGLMMVRMGDADAFLSGLTFDYPSVVRPALQLIGTRPDVVTATGAFMVIAHGRAYFFADGMVNIDPTAPELAGIAILTADFARQLDVEPRVAMLSFSNFGEVRVPQTEKVRQAVEIVRDSRPDLCIDGEMQVDVALSREIADERYPFSRIRDANVLIFPSLAAATIGFRLLMQLGDAEIVGPILLGTTRSVHVLQPTATVTDILRMTAVAAVAAQELSAGQ